MLRRLRWRRVPRRAVLGDASHVNSLTCNATGSYQRDDTPYPRGFLDTFLTRNEAA